MAERRTRDGILNSCRGRNRMKVGVGERSIPARDDIIADAQFQFTQEDYIAEIAVIADLDFASVAEGKMDAIHGAVFTDDEGGVVCGPEALKGVLAFQHGAVTELNV